MSIVISSSGRATKPFLDRIHLLQGDVSEQHVDAMAMVVPQRLELIGDLNDSMQAASGIDLDEFILENIFKPRVGEVYALPAFNLPAKHLFLGIMPNVRTDMDINDSDLSGVVRRMMELARCMLLTSIAFPPLACGKKGFPKPRAARLICQGISDRMEENIEDVRIVCETDDMVDIFQRKLDVLGVKGR